MSTPSSTSGRTYEVRTYGCQMNVHDSERLSGLLEDAGYTAFDQSGAPAGEQADVVVFNTCAVRENADNKLYGNLGHLAPVKAKRPGMQIAVGGCHSAKQPPAPAFPAGRRRRDGVPPATRSPCAPPRRCRPR
jgi:tRNA-2-methylthio-N6-dimethylallyladenosine synthase